MFHLITLILFYHSEKSNTLSTMFNPAGQHKKKKILSTSHIHMESTGLTYLTLVYFTCLSHTQNSRSKFHQLLGKPMPTESLYPLAFKVIK